MPKAKNALTLIAQLCEDKGLKPKVDHLLEFSEEECQKAFSELQGRKTAGKIVIQISEDV